MHNADHGVNLKKKIYFKELGIKEGGGSKHFHLLFHSQMVALTMPGPGHIQEPGTSLRSPRWVIEA